MPGNTIGQMLTLTSFGESHGTVLGGILDGVPPGIELTEADLQPYLDKRKPGQSRHTTQRKESDTIQILSGVFEGRTTGTPIGLMIVNEDQRSKDYGDIKDKFRPGHADYTYTTKYGFRDYRGGGRSSARETAIRVAAGAVARKILDHLTGSAVLVRGGLVQLGDKSIDYGNWDWDTVNANPFFTPDAAVVDDWESYLDSIRKDQSSIGAVAEIVATGIPAGLGEPVFDRLDADLAKAMMSIPAVKGVEIGAGFAAASLRGEENADKMRMNGDEVTFLTNHAGGTLGGISTGQDIIVRLAFKPTSSIPQSQPTVDSSGHDTDIATKGRHDPCVGIRGVPVAEAMAALTLADHLMRLRAQCGK